MLGGMDVSSVVRAQVQVALQKLVLDQVKQQGAEMQRLLTPPAPVDPGPHLGRYIDVRV
jgi:hypothetical protein